MTYSTSLKFRDQGNISDTDRIKTTLEEELERLQRILMLGYDLRVVWVPDANSKLSGEVKNNTIYIYEEDEESAIETLKHEVIDFAISQTIEPYREVTNRLIAMVNEEAYNRKERLVEKLVKLIE